MSTEERGVVIVICVEHPTCDDDKKFDRLKIRVGRVPIAGETVRVAGALFDVTAVEHNARLHDDVTPSDFSFAYVSLTRTP